MAYGLWPMAYGCLVAFEVAYWQTLCRPIGMAYWGPWWPIDRGPMAMGPTNTKGPRIGIDTGPLARLLLYWWWPISLAYWRRQ